MPGYRVEYKSSIGEDLSRIDTFIFDSETRLDGAVLGKHGRKLVVRRRIREITDEQCPPCFASFSLALSSLSPFLHILALAFAPREVKGPNRSNKSSNIPSTLASTVRNTLHACAKYLASAFFKTHKIMSINELMMRKKTKHKHKREMINGADGI